MGGIHKLTAAQIRNVKAGQRIGDGGGLFLHCRAGGAKYWSLQTTIKAVVGMGKRVEVGIGPYPDISPIEARELAKAGRLAARAGKDPRTALRGGTTVDTFESVCVLAYEARKAELKGKGDWLGPLRNHVTPHLGSRRVTDITQNDIVDVLKPIWHTKADTARKAIQRLGMVLTHAAAMDLAVDMQAVAKAKALLGKQSSAVKHIPSMPWQDVPAYYQSLDNTPVALALRLTLLTGLRSANVRFAHADQFDFEANVWTVPAEAMKGGKGKTEAFRVPLSAEAVRVVRAALAQSFNDYLFPSKGKKSPVISDMAMSKRMKDEGMDYRPHGFRSSLRTWLAECTDAPHEVAEVCLQHASGSKVVDAYRRTDYLEKRAALMERWSAHTTGGSSAPVAIAI